jgi:hypothetical protein
MSQATATTIALNPQAADLLAQAQAALAALGLTITQAADLQQAADLVADAEYLETSEIAAVLDLSEAAFSDLLEARSEALQRAAAYLVQA